MGSRLLEYFRKQFRILLMGLGILVAGLFLEAPASAFLGVWNPVTLAGRGLAMLGVVGGQQNPGANIVDPILNAIQTWLSGKGPLHRGASDLGGAVDALAPRLEKHGPMVASVIAAALAAYGVVRFIDSGVSYYFESNKSTKAKEAQSAADQLDLERKYQEWGKANKSDKPQSKVSILQQIYDDSRLDVYDPDWYPKGSTDHTHDEDVIDSDLLTVLGDLNLENKVLSQFTEYTRKFKNFAKQKTNLPNLIIIQGEAVDDDGMMLILIALAQELGLKSKLYSLEPFENAPTELAHEAFVKLSKSVSTGAPKSPPLLLCLFRIGDAFDQLKKPSEFSKEVQAFIQKKFLRLGTVIVKDKASRISPALLQNFKSKANFVIELKQK